MLDDGKRLVEDGPHDSPIRVKAAGHPGSLDQFPKDRFDVAGPNLPRIGRLRIEKLGPMKAEELVALSVMPHSAHSSGLGYNMA
jgi:hypothetical protein